MTPKTRNLVRLALCILCVVGATISAALVRAHAGPWPGAGQTSGLFERLCGGGSGGESGCAAVLKSDWSAFGVTLPVVTRSLSITRQRIVVPVAFVGLAYFVSLGLWFALAGHPATWDRWYIIPLVAVVSGALGSATLMGILVTKLDSRCALCIVIHAINGLLLVGTWLLCRRRRHWPETARADAQNTNFRGNREGALEPIAVFRITGFAVIVIIGLWMYRGAKLEIRQQVAKLLPYKEFVDQRSNDPAFLVREFYAGPVRAADDGIPGDDLIPKEKVPTVTIFTDFQCPHCACFAHKWKTKYLPSWGGPIRVDLRHFPLSKKCNESMVSDLHPEACSAGYAAEAARLQGGDAAFWKMHDHLFASSRRLDTKPFETLATTIGLDGGQLLADMDHASVRDAVARDIALGEELGVHGTPAVFLNGRRVPSFCLHNPIFWEAISADLQRGPGAGAVEANAAVRAAPRRDTVTRSASMIQR